jgi:hypothetical protein
MSNNLSDYAEKACLDWLMGGATPTRPSARYLALFTAAPGETGGGTEMSGGGYARQAVTCDATALGAGTCSNSNALTFTISGVDPLPFTHGAIYDAVSGGNELWYGPLTAQKDLGDGDSIVFAIGELDFDLA